MERIEHEGVVVAVEESRVLVSILSSSACGSCAAKSMCVNSSEEQEKIITCEGEKMSENYKIGEKVKLFISTKTGVRAVLLAYLIPVVLCVLWLSVSLSQGASEAVAGISYLIFLVIYFIILYIFRHKINSKTLIKIEHL